jgi:pimeloyl-ACP methyl ester carboxylesterase
MKAPATTRPIEVPLLHLAGADDGCIGPDVGRGQERHFKGPFESRVLPGLGHFLQLEDPDRVGAEIIGWLRAHPTPAFSRPS